MSIDSKYREKISAFLGLEETAIGLFWKGRVGLYGLLQVMGVRPGDEVIIPAFTCVVVPNAIKYLGATPVYVDVNPDTYNMGPEEVEKHITSNTRVIIAQNTFGLSPNLDPFVALAHKHKLRLIEDCTHGFGGSYQGQPNGTVAEASFFSTQWNKPYSTGLGGITVCQDPQLARQIRNWEASLESPGFFKRNLLQAQLMARDHLLKPALYWQLLKLYRLLSAKGIITGSSSGGELEGIQMPADYLMQMSGIQKKRGLKALADWEANKAHRQKLAALYTEALSDLSVPLPGDTPYASHTYIKYPLLVRDRDYIFGEAEKERVPLGDWMLSPIHPVREGFEKWDYPYGKNPRAEFLSDHVINLQTDPGISLDVARRSAAFIRNHKNQLYRKEELPF
ncbi:MAG: aminotransferase class I/II-fold pyridoxal phosphate-dependent enzyme [Bacteroidetes bacterium]|nr:aminotransferase class I/II-fold pyridoxal phosphate-dependent enzyme [Bacteroidota bacterium]